MPFKYFLARVKGVDGKVRVIYGTSEPNWGQSVEGQAKHIALVRGFGSSKVLSVKVFPDSESWYKAQYRKGTGLQSLTGVPMLPQISSGSIKLSKGQRHITPRTYRGHPVGSVGALKDPQKWAKKLLEKTGT